MFDLSAVELGSRILSRELSPVEVLRAVFERLDATEPTLNAFISRRDDEAMVEAAAAEREIQSGQYRGPLHGMPVAVKDNIAVAGTRTTAGSRVLADNITPEDAEAVRRLRAAGAIVVGKTNMHEFAYGATGLNPHYGDTRNPWNPSLVAGGSSSGSGAAVAGLQVPLAIGTDAAGSIRMPASLCGIVGVKGTHGRVSARGLLASHNPTVDHIGPMARSVEDAALLLDAMAGFDAADPYSADRPVPAFGQALQQRSDLRGLRVGVPTDYFFDLIDPEVERVVRAAIDELKRLGAELVEVALPDLEDMMPLRLALFADGLALHGPYLRSHPELYGEEIRQRLLVDCFVTAQDNARAIRVRRLLQEQFAAVFRSVDLLVAPGTAIAATPLDQWMVEVHDNRSGLPLTQPTQLFLLRGTAPANLLGIPALSVPCGFTADHRPVGLQLMARPWEEAMMLTAAHLYEKATAWDLRPPPII